ncbi:TBC1 domain family member 10B [Cyprinodon tularosa]|uniref:TBC1 domain family member 10B n=1 Tax=Cyprinodon tularosa TaxID=77115 RepID=UPI0018E258BD|nr:TBC1 domain family member 10B [Cyprinodon tularosa]
MRRRSSSNASRRSSTNKRRSDSLGFDEFGFAFTSKKEQKLHHRCHDYSYPQLSLVRVKELCELLSYWNGASFICRSQIERFIRMGIPPSLRGRVWKCLLNIDSLRESSEFNYQTCLSEVRGPLVDLGVSEYGILSAITTLSETQNDLRLNQQQPSSSSDSFYSMDEITLFRQIALDLQRSFPTHRSLMGQSPEAIEGQAKLFRVLIAYAKYNPQVGYSQGMSYIAAVLLMQLGEEEAFWALAALLDKPRYLGELFDLSLTKVQHQVKVFDQFLKHRKAQLSKHLDSAGVLSVHFVMPWFLTLFTSLPCWDSVLAVWDLIILQGLPAVVRTALSIIELLESRLMELKDEGAILPLLLRVPVDVAQYTVLVSALWQTEVQDWELKCMNSLVLDDGRHESEEKLQQMSSKAATAKETRHISTSSEGERTTEKVPGKMSLLGRVMRVAQRYLFSPSGHQKVEEKCSQTQAEHRHRSPGRVFHRRTSGSLTQAQARMKRQSKQRGSGHQAEGQGGSGGMSSPPATGKKPAGSEKTERCEPTIKRSGTGSAGKMTHRRSNRSIVHHARVKSHHVFRNGKTSPVQNPSTTLVPRASRRSSTLPRAFSPSNPSLQSTGASQSGEPQETPNTALIRELSSRHQTSVPFSNIRESKLI